MVCSDLGFTITEEMKNIRLRILAKMLETAKKQMEDSEMKNMALKLQSCEQL
jgi:hypothetical protein